MRLILASKSPRRREILTMLGVPFEIVTQDTPEFVPQGTPPRETVCLLSAQKAQAVAQKLYHGVVWPDDAYVLGADTVVSVDDRILGKPRDLAEASDMLRVLSGRAHQVYTGLTVLHADRCVSEAACTVVHMRAITEQERKFYVAAGEPIDKAGAYAIQGRGSLFVDRIEGDFYNVIVLPITLLQQMLQQQFGVRLSAWQSRVPAENGAR